MSKLQGPKQQAGQLDCWFMCHATLNLLRSSSIDQQPQPFAFTKEMLLTMPMLLLSHLVYSYMVPCHIANPASAAEEGCGQHAHITIVRCRPQDIGFEAQADPKSRD